MTSDQRKINPWLALVVLCIGNFVILIDTTIVNTAVPSIITSIHASVSEILWVLNAYLLVFASLLITCGRVGDIIGPKTAFVSGLAVFTAASAVCGLARVPAELIAARVVQGAGAALLIPQALVLITAMFPPQRRGTAMGIFVSLAGLATISGPSIGGLLVTSAGWYWVFFLNVPIGIVGIILGLRFIPDLRVTKRHRFDIVGVITATLGLAALGFGLIEGQQFDWGTVAGPVSIPMIMLMGAMMLMMFVFWERRHPEPLLPLELFRNRNYSIAVAINAVMAFGLFGFLLSYVLLTQSALSMSALRSGLTALPFAVAMVLIAPLAGRLSDRFGGRYLLAGGLVISAAGLLALAAVASPTATSMTFFGVLIVAGVGTGLAFPPSVAEAMRSAPAEQAAAASGMVNTARQVGGAFGAAVAGAVLLMRLAANMHAGAVATAGQFPAAIRANYVNAFGAALKQGLEVQSSEGSGFHVAGVSNTYLQTKIVPVALNIFVRAYMSAMLDTLLVVIGVLLLGVLAALFMRRDRPRTDEVATPVSAAGSVTPA